MNEFAKTFLKIYLHDSSKSQAIGRFFWRGTYRLFTWSKQVAFLEGRLLSSQSEQSEKFSKSSDWLEKSRPFKKVTFAL